MNRRKVIDAALAAAETVGSFEREALERIINSGESRWGTRRLMFDHPANLIDSIGKWSEMKGRWNVIHDLLTEWEGGND